MLQMVMALPDKSLAFILNDRKQIKHQNLSFAFDENAIMGDILKASVSFDFTQWSMMKNYYEKSKTNIYIYIS